MAKSSLIPTVCCVVVLAACGGGGGGGGGGSTPAVPLGISAANAPAVSGATYDNGQLVFTASALSSAATGVSASSPAQRFDLARFARAQLTKLAGVQSNGVVVATGAQVTKSQPCGSGGSVAVTLDDLDGNNKLSAGETIKADFTNCVESGLTLNGSFTLNAVSLAGDPSQSGAGPYNITVDFTFSGLSVVETSNTFLINGGFRLGLVTNDRITLNSSISGASLTATVNSDNTTLSNFADTLTENSTTGAYSYTSKGTLYSSKLGGTVTFETIASFQGVGSDYPSSGVMKVTGANQTSLQFTAVDSGNTKLEVDTNGDSAFEATINKTWAEIDAA